MNYHNVSSRMRSLFKLVNKIKPQLSWWVKIATAQPDCIYYFGPFDSQAEATIAHSGYLEDLVAERASGISIEIKQDQPKILTIDQEDNTVSEFQKP